LRAVMRSPIIDGTARTLTGEATMALQMRPLHSAFGVEILEIDVRTVDDAAFGKIRRARDDHSVLLFRGQTVSDEEQIAFSQRFGPLEKTIRSIAQQERDLPEISNLANVDADNRLIPRG
jgi:alpha-ketoglutarate-dependent 2,4-dichlorophenoxyacetate dioxygenase